MPTRFLPLPLLVVGAALTGCSAPSLDVALRAQRLTLDGDMAATSPPITATSSVDDLGIGDSDWSLSPRVDATLGPVRLTADAFRSSWSGDGTATTDITIGGQTITVGAPVQSNLDLGLARLAATFTIVPLHYLHFGLGLGVAYTDFDANLSTTTPVPTLLETSESTAFPFLAARIGGGVGPLRFDVLGGFVDLEVSGVDARYIDVEALLRLRLLDAVVHAELIGGWRWIALEAEYDDDGSRVLLDLTLSGPFIGLSVGL